MTDELTLDEILELQKEPDPTVKSKSEPKPPPIQTSRYLKWTEKNLRCASRGCGASAHITIKGVPYCVIHTIHILTDLLDEQINHYPNRSTIHEALLKAHCDNN